MGDEAACIQNHLVQSFRLASRLGEREVRGQFLWLERGSFADKRETAIVPVDPLIEL